MPNRILKESICTSDTLDQLNSFQENVFYRLIVNCDDYGRMDARPKILVSKLYPLKNIRAEQINEALQALSSAELVILYEVDGKPFLQMRTWERHQTIRAKQSKYPAPDGWETEQLSKCKQLHADESKCKQLHADESKCSRNPIQSNRIRDGITREAFQLMSEGEMDEAAVQHTTTSTRLWEAMESAGMPMTSTVRDAVEALSAQHGLDSVLAAMVKAAEHDTRGGVSVAYLRSILDGGEKAQSTPKTRTKLYPVMVNGEIVMTEMAVNE